MAFAILNQSSFRATSKVKGILFKMAKAGMRRPDPKDPHGTESNKKSYFPKNEAPPVPDMQGKVKSGKELAKPI